MTVFWHIFVTDSFLTDFWQISDSFLKLSGPPLYKSGTLSQCWSRNFWKSVKYLSEICQKTVSYKNISENSHKCVRILSENCQMQISVRTLSEKIWKCIRNVSDFINVSENCQCFIWKTVWNLSELSLLTDFWHIYQIDELGSAPTYTIVLLKFVLWLGVVASGKDRVAQPSLT